MSGRILIGGGVAALAAVTSGILLLTRSAADAPTPDEAAVSASRHFLGTYLAEDGRVIRHDQGGDTVSEGQAYAMLLAAAIDDEGRFERAWEWTTGNLQRPDGLFSSHWRDGAVIDPEPAADADLDIARALLVASERFGRPEYRDLALRVAGAVLEHEVAAGGDRQVLLAGPWAAEEGTVNPSYFDTRTFAALAAASGDPRWAELAASSREIVTNLTASPPALPPDWASIEGGSAHPIAAPGEPASGTRYGYDAVRLPVRFADSCQLADRELAARSWPFLRGERAAGGIDAEYGLDGTVLAPGAHPAALVSASASAGAAGDLGAREDLLAEAAEAESASPSYYGAAWVALGRVMLTTDRLGAC